MAHPSSALPTNTYLISAATNAESATGDFTPKNADHFFAVTCTIAGTLKIKGAGVYEYVDVTDATDTFQNYIDPTTGVAFANDAAINTRGDAYYQRIDSVYTDIAMIAGQTVYGKFASVISDGTFTGFAYAG